MRKLRPLLTLAVIATLLWFWQGPAGPSRIDAALADATGETSEATDATAAARPTAAAPAAVDAFERLGLPPEARDTLALIARDGPYPHRQDGGVFSNFEGRLPSRPRGYYREFTVRTPGLSHRGPRRIVTGGRPPVEYWYTDDHYESFRRFEPQP
ncbi:MAG TPA: ribonuclease domain-containing protein [Arenimonas sp.]|uniref:ribonuclease domain-containing protein n=1 Tax=Arenimonas sp. TaxID=1872635 RepID=UPI002D80192F|nr:ribonuclease domain-containing protein [Arenimonas sp.]HEU0151999.1 ribonuclease domain-containing protein [Arenimonas sp.]